MARPRLTIRHLGPIERAELEFGDLTVFVGPQASGKSIALQTLKLALDRPVIERTLRDAGLVWTDGAQLLDLVYGEGMRSIWTDATRVTLAHTNGSAAKELDPNRGPSRQAVQAARERVAYVPAQRVMSIRDGWTRPFGQYQSGDPYVLREFSQRVHDIVQGELSGAGPLFPRAQRFHDVLRGIVRDHVLAGYHLDVDTPTLQKRFVLRPMDAAHETTGPSLPFLTWSAGQREFVPMLLGMYRLMPAGRTSRRDALAWAVIEEPEMALHPRAIAATMAFVFELIRRGYRVALSTHSTHVLDVAWGLNRLREHGAKPTDVLDMLGLRRTRESSSMAGKALEAQVRVYAFARNEAVQDISRLDPASDDATEADWAGITGFSENVASVVSGVVRRSWRSEATTE